MQDQNHSVEFTNLLQCKALNKQDELQRKGSPFIFLVSAIRKNLAETFKRITEIKIRNAGGARGMENYLRASAWPVIHPQKPHLTTEKREGELNWKLGRGNAEARSGREGGDGHRRRRRSQDSSRLKNGNPGPLRVHGSTRPN